MNTSRTPGPIRRLVTSAMVRLYTRRRWKWVDCAAGQNGNCCHTSVGGWDSEFMGCMADAHNDWIAAKWYRRYVADVRAAIAGSTQ